MSVKAAELLEAAKGEGELLEKAGGICGGIVAFFAVGIGVLLELGAGLHLLPHNVGQV